MQGEKDKPTTAAAQIRGQIDWTVVYEVHGPALFAFLRRALGSHANAEDLLQEVFIRAMRAATQPGPDEIRPWLFRIASNLAISDHRRRRIVKYFSLASHDAIVASTVDEEAEQVRAALHSIPRDQAVTLTLALHEGFSRREIAQMLGIGEEAVKSRLARGRRSFAAAYRQQG